jgi:hypothetical protein
MKFQITLSREQYATLMTSLAYTDATLHEGEFHDKVEALTDHITSTFELVEPVSVGA